MAQQKIKVAINGFGRIGRLAFRLMFGSEGYEVVAINNRSAEPVMLTHLLKYDSLQGRYALADKTSVEGDYMVIDGKKIKIYDEPDPAKLPWKELGVDVVLECTGAFTSMEKASLHIAAGAKKVIISAPAKDPMPTVVYNVNHKILKATDTVISAASCTTNCLAPMAKALNDLCGIEKGIMTTIHAYTGDQNPLDAPHKNGDMRRARAAAVNIVPNTTGAAKAIGLVIPELNGKLDGAAQRVPVATGSLTELTAVVNKPATKEQINAHMKSVSNESFGYTDEQLVSSDIIGSAYGSLFDSTQTKVMTMGDKALVKVVAWYDNEMGYTHQMIRTIKYFMELK